MLSTSSIVMAAFGLLFLYGSLAYFLSIAMKKKEL